MITLLLIDDDPDILEWLSFNLHDAGINALWCGVALPRVPRKFGLLVFGLRNDGSRQWNRRFASARALGLLPFSVGQSIQLPLERLTGAFGFFDRFARELLGCLEGVLGVSQLSLSRFDFRLGYSSLFFGAARSLVRA